MDSLEPVRNASRNRGFSGRGNETRLPFFFFGQPLRLLARIEATKQLRSRRPGFEREANAAAQRPDPALVRPNRKASGVCSRRSQGKPQLLSQNPRGAELWRAGFSCGKMSSGSAPV